MAVLLEKRAEHATSPFTQKTDAVGVPQRATSANQRFPRRYKNTRLHPEHSPRPKLPKLSPLPGLLSKRPSSPFSRFSIFLQISAKNISTSHQASKCTRTLMEPLSHVNLKDRRERGQGVAQKTAHPVDEDINRDQTRVQNMCVLKFY
jgi:hypothetical protein